MNIFLTIAAFLVALGILVTVHELGHYWMARFFGVKVIRFSIGFGPALLKWSSGSDRTVWVIGALPLGGYVKMLDEREETVAEAEFGRTFNRQAVWRRMMIVAAGPAANFGLAMILYWLLMASGVREARPILAQPESQTRAALAGVKSRDEIKEIDGQPVRSWQEARWQLIKGIMNDGRLSLVVMDDEDKSRILEVNFADIGIGNPGDDPLLRSGFSLFRPTVPPVIGRVIEGEAAQIAGLRAGDLIQSAGGRSIDNWEEFVELVRANGGQLLTITVLRNGMPLQIEIVPATTQVAGNGRGVGRIGASPNFPEAEIARLSTVIHYDALESLYKAWGKCWDTAAFTLRIMVRILTGEVSWRNISGPVTIAEYAGQSAQLGAMPYLSFLALVSISLFVLNLLPIPLLDGGHLLYYMIEFLKGSPLSDDAMEIGQRMGMGVIMILLAFALFNDFTRVFSG